MVMKRSVNETLNDSLMFSLVHNNMFSINNMSDEEVRQSIIDDVLLITMLEKGENTTIEFGQHQLFRWIKPYQHSRVYKQMCHPEISGLIEQKNGQIRIKDQREILQASMDYCGHWWDGFTIPNEPGIVTLNHDVFEEKVNAAGGFDQFVEGLTQTLMVDLMDVDATVAGNKTVN